ncbi:hypothetical protein C1H46_001868 [Malus baccata]|uniref:Stomatal closure-related actin-binding protein coiled-coil domain-containing protein n=1 Tax=Malus baccata TaxID=106549 RepID=A0A540NN66_MALBA|nr:hypothetical protein C1H46_001868 [Malus baccata]
MLMQLSSMFLVSSLTWLKSFLAVSPVQVQSPGTPPVQAAMESVINMMREVEVQEKAVDIVQEEAYRGGLDIMVKVEELKQMLAHAKDANDMVVFCEIEVFGEKAILATEARELQSRLLNLSDERDKSLEILNEGESATVKAQSKRISNGFSRKCAALVKEQRARIYILRRCATKLLCWYIQGDD